MNGISILHKPFTRVATDSTTDAMNQPWNGQTPRYLSWPSASNFLRGIRIHTAVSRFRLIETLATDVPGKDATLAANLNSRISGMPKERVPRGNL